MASLHPRPIDLRGDAAVAPESPLASNPAAVSSPAAVLPVQANPANVFASGRILADGLEPAPAIVALTTVAGACPLKGRFASAVLARVVCCAMVRHRLRSRLEEMSHTASPPSAREEARAG